MKIQIKLDNIGTLKSVNNRLIEYLADGKDMETITGLMELNYRIIDALVSGNTAVLVADISVKYEDEIGVPKSDLCGCYHNGYCWGTKEVDPCYCGGRKSRCTFYKKGL